MDEIELPLQLVDFRLYLGLGFLRCRGREPAFSVQLGLHRSGLGFEFALNLQQVLRRRGCIAAVRAGERCIAEHAGIGPRDVEGQRHDLVGRLSIVVEDQLVAGCVAACC